MQGQPPKKIQSLGLILALTGLACGQTCVMAAERSVKVKQAAAPQIQTSVVSRKPLRERLQYFFVKKDKANKTNVVYPVDEQSVKNLSEANPKAKHKRFKSEKNNSSKNSSISNRINKKQAINTSAVPPLKQSLAPRKPKVHEKTTGYISGSSVKPGLFKRALSQWTSKPKENEDDKLSYRAMQGQSHAKFNHDNKQVSANKVDHHTSISDSQWPGRIECHGSLRLMLDPLAKKNTLVKNSQTATINRRSGSLVVAGRRSSGKGFDIVLKGEQWLKALTTITLHDGCSLTGRHLSRDHQWSLISDTLGSIDLQGYAGIRSIQQLRNNTIKTVWLDSDILSIDSQTGRIIIAGRVNNLRVNARGSSHIDTSNLRGQSIWLNMAGDAVVSSVGGRFYTASLSQQAFASATSYPNFNNFSINGHAVVSLP